jgi:hypothetical protein
MKTFACLFALLAPALAVSGAATGIDTTVNGIPAGTSEVVVLIEAAAPPPAPDYQDPAQQAVPAKPDDAVQQKQEDVLKQLPPPAAAEPQAQVAAAQAAAPTAATPQNAAGARQGQRQGFRGRRGRAGQGAAMAASTESYRAAVKPDGATSVTVHSIVPAGSNYRIRVVAIKGNDPFPAVLAGGRTAGVKVETDKITAASVSLAAPVLKLSDDLPASVAANSHFILRGTIDDPSDFLGTKTRMRVWLSDGKPPAANYDGMQVSTVDVTIKDDLVTFNFDLTAPKDPTTLYFQLGEVSPDFARKDGSQAAFLVLPDLSAGASPLQLRVEAAKTSVASKD